MLVTARCDVMASLEGDLWSKRGWEGHEEDQEEVKNRNTIGDGNLLNYLLNLFEHLSGHQACACFRCEIQQVGVGQGDG